MMIYATEMLLNLKRNTETGREPNQNTRPKIRGGIPGTDSHNDAVGLVIPRVRLLLLLQHPAGIFSAAIQSCMIMRSVHRAANAG